MNVLVLAGSSEARQLATLLSDEPGVVVTASLAGLTSSPARYPCPVRTGGFGGAGGLARHLRDDRVDVLVDATHPCSRTMPHLAAAAADVTQVPRLRLARPPWVRDPRDHWHDADDVHDAAQVVTALGLPRVLLTIGRIELEAFAHVPASFVVRAVERPRALPPRVEATLPVLASASIADEIALLREQSIDVLVTRNAGGNDAKLVAARTLGIPVVVIRRPTPVPGPVTTTATAARDWVLDRSR